jgi:hypothetical protein
LRRNIRLKSIFETLSMNQRSNLVVAAEVHFDITQYLHKEVSIFGDPYTQ